MGITRNPAGPEPAGALSRVMPARQRPKVNRFTFTNSWDWPLVKVRQTSWVPVTPLMFAGIVRQNWLTSTRPLTPELEF